MNSREKKLIFILFGAAFLIVNLFLFTSYQSAKQKKEVALKKNAAELQLKHEEMNQSEEKVDEMNWLIDHAPQEGNHSDVRADLVTFTETSAKRNRVKTKKRPTPIPEDIEEQGAYRTARVKVTVNAADPELHRWLIELQDPEKSRSITYLRIQPQRDDPHRVDCELELTQWFYPATGENSEEISSN